MRSYAKNSIEAEIRHVLMSSWDPIGVASVPQAADEYDNYLPRIAEAIVSNRDRYEIARLLLDIEANDLGLKSDNERALNAADRLLALRNRS